MKKYLFRRTELGYLILTFAVLYRRHVADSPEAHEAGLRAVRPVHAGAGSLIGPGSVVGGCFVDVVDDDHFHGILLRLHFQAQELPPPETSDSHPGGAAAIATSPPPPGGAGGGGAIPMSNEAWYAPLRPVLSITTRSDSEVSNCARLGIVKLDISICSPLEPMLAFKRSDARHESDHAVFGLPHRHLAKRRVARGVAFA